MAKQKTVVCIGAGPAGLTAAYLLSKRGIDVTVLEMDSKYVGGISRTVEHKGFRFDIGGHRFFSKSAEVEALWTELLPDDFLERPRTSRIYYQGKYFAYPLKAVEALVKLGPIESLRCVISYAKARLFPIRDAANFEDWVSNQFGRRLFEIFFKTYTEKVWGMSCTEISADWAAQRIKGLSLASAVANGLVRSFRLPTIGRSRKKVIKSLIESFRYPRKGPGMMWEAAASKTQSQGGEVQMGCRVERVERDERHDLWIVHYVKADGSRHEITAKHVISTAPLRELVEGLKPSDAAVAAARRLKYRDFLTVALILRERASFDDNWIYIHEPSVKVGRIQNFKSWSPEMIPDPSLACYGLEYFCFEGDGLWSQSDSDLIALATRELQQLGLASPGDVIDGCVVRQAKAYPVYDDEYAAHIEVIRNELERSCPNLHVIGRNGMHKYNNQDHAMMTAMLTVENIVAGRNAYDVWKVNQDAEYHETTDSDADAGRGASGLRLVPTRVAPAPSPAVQDRDEDDAA